MQKDGLYLKFIRNILPSPFSIAVLLTALTFILALIFTERPENAVSIYPIKILEYWETGFWELLEFTMQMALILILGHALALTSFFDKIISTFTKYCHNTAYAALWISLLTISMSFLNWGLCLVFGAIFARKVAENAKRKGLSLNYPLIAAAGYIGMMCWHGGFSGSAPLTVAANNHFLEDQIGRIGIEQTIFSPMNIVTSLLLLIIIPTTFYLLGKRSAGTEINLPINTAAKSDLPKAKLIRAEKIDHSKIFAVILGELFAFWLYEKFG